MQRRILQHGRRPSTCQRCQTGSLLLMNAGTLSLGAMQENNFRHRYKNVLQTASESIAGSYGPSPGILALNLGPVWSNADAYNLFGNNVIEISFKEWESPPGLGICPLDVIFSVCYSISSWLSLNEDHVVVSPPQTQSNSSNVNHSNKASLPHPCLNTDCTCDLLRSSSISICCQVYRCTGSHH